MKLSRIGLLTVGIALMLSAVVCFGGRSEPSEIDRYKQDMNLIMQRHWDAYTELTSKVSKTYSSLMSGQTSRLSSESLNATLNDVLKDFETAELDLARIAEDWTRLVPPSKANRFHQLTFEMMQLRLKGVQRNRLVFAKLLNTGTLDSEAAGEAESLFDKSERVWLEVLAEAKELGGADITTR